MIYNHVTYSLSNLDMEMVRSVPPGGNWKDIPVNVPSKRLAKIRETGGRTTLYGRMEWNKPSYTITTYFNRPGNGTYIHPDQDRVISAREAARIQSFKDGFRFFGSKTSLLKQIGNAVPPLLSYQIAKKIKEHTGVNNVIDLFSGSGGLSSGFSWAGFDIILANDNFNHACTTYRYNHPKTIFLEGDITDENVKNELYSNVHDKKIDIIIGGPPCQGFSHAGKRLIDDPRNRLFKEFVEIVKKIRPKVILVENVEGILSFNKGKAYESIKNSFEELGYHFDGQKLHAADYGIPQKRKRVIMIGILNGNPEKCFPDKLIIKKENYITIEDTISNLPHLAANGGEQECEIRIKPESKYQEFLSGEINVDDFLEYCRTRNL